MDQNEESRWTEPPPWQEGIRAQFPLLKEVAFFQTGSLTPLADCVRTAMTNAMHAEGITGLKGDDAYQIVLEEAEVARRHLATFLGVKSEEIGWVTNTTMAIRHVTESIEWRPGDVVVRSSTEHVSTCQMCSALAERYDVRVVVVPVEEGNERFLEHLDGSMEREVQAKLLILSHVSSLDGRRLPVFEATRIAHERGVRVLVDGAQSIGQFPVNLAQIGCDFCASSTHKWLLGPAGLGFLYVAQEQLERFQPRSLILPAALHSDGRLPTVAAAMEMGTQSVAPKAGLHAILTLLEQLGGSAIESYVARLSSHLRTGLRNLPGVTVVTPLDEPGSGITTFIVGQPDPEETQHVVNRLWEEAKVVVKVQREFPAVRVSIAAFNTMEDVNRLLEGLNSLLAT